MTAHPDSHRSNLSAYQEKDLKTALEVTLRFSEGRLSPRDEAIAKRVIRDIEAELTARYK